MENNFQLQPCSAGKRTVTNDRRLPRQLETGVAVCDAVFATILLPEAQHWGPKKYFNNFTVVFRKKKKSQLIIFLFLYKRANDKNKFGEIY